MMAIHIQLWRLQIYAVLGRVWLPVYNEVQRSCLRIVWNGAPKWRFGHDPEPAAL